MDTPTSSENALTIERIGGVKVIVASKALERMDPSLVEGASALLLDQIRGAETPLVLFDLSRLGSFGSTFLALMIRCWKHASEKGGQMALCGVSPTVRDLLRVTSLDTVWPLYDTRPEALAALLSD
jgi:anti-sigma B factor antagonist